MSTAIAAPLLVGLGFDALPVAILTLLMNSVPATFGAVGHANVVWLWPSPAELVGDTIRELEERSATNRHCRAVPSASQDAGAARPKVGLPATATATLAGARRTVPNAHQSF